MGEHTVEALVRRVGQLFSAAAVAFGHGTDNALDEAAYLVFAVLELDHDQIPAAYATRVSEDDVQRILALAARRTEERIPVAYLVNEAWFAGRRFFVDERVLIPRSPFAELIQRRFSPWVDPRGVQNVLELGTGSGCIAVSVALELSDVRVVAVDIMRDALEVARINVERYGMSERVQLLHSDLYSALSASSHGRFDLILSNPPYVDQREMAELPTEYRHEPAVALASGFDGLDSTIAILHDAADFLTDAGVLVVEVGNSQAALNELFPQVPFVWLDFEYGGSGVFLIGKSDLLEHRESFAAEARHRRGG